MLPVAVVEFICQAALAIAGITLVVGLIVWIANNPFGRKCPACRSNVDPQATRCPHCTSELTRPS